MTKNKIFKTDIDVRFRDLDAMGHVNNAVYFTYFEEGRKNFSHEIFRASDPSEFRFILAHICCDFLSPVKLADRVALLMSVNRIGTKSFGYEYRLVSRSDDSVVYAAAESVQVCYDYNENTSMAIPDEMKEKLSEYTRR